MDDAVHPHTLGVIMPLLKTSAAGTEIYLECIWSLYYTICSAGVSIAPAQHCARLASYIVWIDMHSMTLFTLFMVMAVRNGQSGVSVAEEWISRDRELHRLQGRKTYWIQKSAALCAVVALMVCATLMFCGCGQSNCLDCVRVLT